VKINDAVFGVILLALGIAVLWHAVAFKDPARTSARRSSG
jgi:hypothetical protein